GYDDKRRSAEFAAKLLRHLNVNGAVVTFAHGGHAITDLVLTCEACQRLGGKGVRLMFEIAGEDGVGFRPVQGGADAETMVSTGNAYALVSIPEVERTLGGDALHGLGGQATVRRDARGPANILLAHVAAASGPTGWGRLTTRAG